MKTPLVILGIVLTAAAVSPQLRVTERHAADPIAPFTMRDDFQGDGLGQWASYPPAQDVGYEPSLTPTTQLAARGGRSLMRVVRPTAAGPLRIGFIKHVPFIAERTARFSFAYRLDGAGTRRDDRNWLCRRLRTAVCAARRTATTDSWAEMTLTAADFASAGSPLVEHEAVQAIYIVANIAAASPDVTYRFVLDDVSLTASAPAAFTVMAPGAAQYNPWPAQLVTSVGYRAGSTVAVEAVAPLRMSRVESRFAPQAMKPSPSPRRYTTMGHMGDIKAGDGHWTNDSALCAEGGGSARDLDRSPSGAKAGRRHYTDDVPFHGSRTSQAHPRLYFAMRKIAGTYRQEPGIHDSQNCGRRLRNAPKQLGTAALSRMADGSFELLDREYLLPSLLGYFDVLNRARQPINNNRDRGFPEWRH